MGPAARLAATPVLVALSSLLAVDALAGQEPAPSSAPEESVLLQAGRSSGLPLVVSNDNRRAAGRSAVSGLHEVRLEVVRADWRPETPDRPGLRVAAVAEVGGAPTVPAPLLRVKEGTRLRIRVRNALDGGEALTVFGLHDRAGTDTMVVVPSGETRVVEFTAPAPGTYMYWMREGPEPPADAPPRFEERSQLAGAFVVDPAAGAVPDRVMVINIFSQPVDTAVAEFGFVEGLAINGRSWPHTERLAVKVGERERWRVVNASERVHPMHLHGFYFEVHARGTTGADTLYAERDRRLVVTESMRGMTTMLMEWVPSRPGTWLFHCHLSFHVSPETRLPGASDADPEHEHVHMAGLVMGIEVAPGPSDLVQVGAPRPVDLYVNRYGDHAGYRYGFSLERGARPDSLVEAPGPVLFFRQHEVADVTVVNDMSIPTGVHWHGLELDAWADGVPNWSRSDGKVSPVIPPGGSFTYRLSFMRPGTFIYHSHLDDVDQLTGGLYGALIVLGPGETFEPERDHLLVWGWETPGPSGPQDFALNGRREQPGYHAAVGDTHRFRVINIAPAGMLTAWLTRDGDEARVPLVLHAKDGADLPPHQRVGVDQLARLGVGETADFTWTPDRPGVYRLHVGYGPQAHFVQTWEVTPATGRPGA